MRQDLAVQEIVQDPHGVIAEFNSLSCATLQRFEHIHPVQHDDNAAPV